ncbi:MAG: tRNA glutamyl-Q(34) synthetase GluQRS [Planctomycetota bacterium]
MSTVVGRLAPSPTGSLHLGHARTFLLAWWHARARGGRVLLRIEDLDQERVKPGMLAECLATLAWLGLDWDGEPLVQSREPEPARAALAELVARGLAYGCDCSRKDIERAASAPHAGDGELRYPGTCRERGLLARGDARLGLRFRVPAGELALEDGCAGPFRSDVAREVGDFLLARRDGAFAYQLAVVVDDARAGVTEVLRGADLLPSTARQALLQRALGLASPRWFHVPLVLDAEGERLAKRSGALALAELRARGVDPRAIVAWAAQSAGQVAPEWLTPAELLPRFDLARLPRAPVRLTGADRPAFLGSA